MLSQHRDAQPPGKGLGSLTFIRSPPASHPWGRRASARSQDPGVSLWMWTRIHPALDYAHERGAPQPQNPGDTPTPAASRAQLPRLGCVGSASAPGSGMGCRGTPDPGGPRPCGYLPVLQPSLPALGGVTFVPPHPSAGGCRDRHRAMGTCRGHTWAAVGTQRGALGDCTGDRETPGPWGHAGGPQGCALGLWGRAHPGAHWSPPALAAADTEGPAAGTEGKGGKSQEQHSKCCKGAQGWQEGQHRPPGSKPPPSPSSMDNPAGLRSPSLYLCTKDVILPDSGQYSQLKANLCK